MSDPSDSPAVPPVRIGIVGYGGIGGMHSNYLAKGDVPGATLAAVADVDPAALDRAARKHGDAVRRFDSAEAMYDSGDVDAVLIATPHYFHPPLAVAAFARGLHVMSEKPAGVSVKPVRAMIAAAATHPQCVFGIMFNQRTLGEHKALRRLIASGELGEIKRTQYVITDWMRTQRYYDVGGWRGTWAGEGGGVLLNQSPHNLDLFQWWCGMPTRVRAFAGFGRYHEMETEDDVTAFLEYPNGATGTFVAGTGEAPGTNRFEVHGDRGKAVLEEGKLTFWRTEVPVSEHIRTSPESFAQPPAWRCQLPGGGGPQHKGITANWVEAIRTGAPLVAPGAEGIHMVELANAMLLSAWTDDWADLPVDADRYEAMLQEKIESSRFRKRAGPTGPVDFAGSF